MEISEKIRNLKPTLPGKLSYYLLPLRKKTVLSNMKLVFNGSLSPAEIKKLAQCFYGHMFTLILENLRMGWMSGEQIRDEVRVIGHDIITKALEKNKGMLIFTGHFGNWELAPVGAIHHFKTIKGRMHVLRKLLTNKFFERILFRRFYEAGLNVIPQKNSLNQVLDAIGRNEAVVFIMDQYARTGKDGILVDFFGHKAGTFKSLALIARQTGAPVIPMVCYREPDGTHVAKFSEPLSWIENPDSDLEIAENTRAYNRVIEETVLEHPDQWLWAHRRWKVK